MAQGTLIDPSEGSPVAVDRSDGAGDVILVCEHASRRIPASLGDLGLDDAALESHIAWDIGALSVAELVSSALDATLVTQTFSRLAYDCNRPPEALDAMPARSEIYDIPGNRDLSDEARTSRTVALYHPFHQTLSGLVEARIAAGRTPVLVTVHSFTPVYFGAHRDGELGILHDADTRLADALLEAATAHGLEGVRRNYPYGPADGVTHTLKRHALPRGLLNVMLEIRHDQIRDHVGQTLWAGRVAELIRAALSSLSLAAGEGRHYG